MSTFEDHGYRWRETYFVLFDSARRPTLEQVRSKLKKLNARFELSPGEADDHERFESISIRAPQDCAAMDISYQSGEEMAEQLADLQAELKASIDPADRPKFNQMARCDAKFDILHFEQVFEGEESEEEGESLDPSALLSVMDALVELTGGVGVDPQSGTLM